MTETYVFKIGPSKLVVTFELKTTKNGTKYRHMHGVLEGPVLRDPEKSDLLYGHIKKLMQKFDHDGVPIMFTRSDYPKVVTWIRDDGSWTTVGPIEDLLS